MRKLTIIFSTLVFVLILVILNSVVFTVSMVNAYCYNSKDETLIANVAASGAIMRGRNIFTLSEKKYAAPIEETLRGDIKVINIERKFPSIVWINFVKIIPVFAFLTEDGTYVTVDNDRVVHRVGAGRSELNFDAAVEAFDTAAEGILIPVTATGAPMSPVPGERLVLPAESQNAVFVNFVSALNRLDYYEYDFLHLIAKMDLGRVDGETGKLLLTMRRSEKKNAVDVEIWNSGSRLLEKARYAVTLYEKYMRDEIALPSNSIKVYEDSKQIIHAAV